MRYRGLSVCLVVTSAAVASTSWAFDLDAARQREQRGQQLESMSPPDARAAIGEYEEAYRLLEGHPLRHRQLNNIANAYQSLGLYDRALVYFERFLREAGPDERMRDRVEAAATALRSILGSLTVRADVAEAEVWIDQRSIGLAPGPFLLPGGRHAVEVRRRGFSPARREIVLASRQQIELSVTLDPLGRRLSPVFFWSGLGVTVVTTGLAVAFGASAMAARSDLDVRLGSNDEMVRFSVGPDDRAHIATLSETADVFYGVSGALAVGTLILGLLTDSHGRPSTAPVVGIGIRPLATTNARGVALEARW